MKQTFKKHDELKNEVLNWLESLRIQGAPYGTYKMSHRTEATIFSSCFAVFVRELYNDMKNVTSKQRREWTSLISDNQDPESGLFVDPCLKRAGLFSEHLGRKHDWGYVTWQSTTFCISALDALGGQIKYPFRFLEKWKNPYRVISWLESLDWRKGVWAAGNLAMFLGVCLITDYEKNGNTKTKDAIDAFFNWHDAAQDPKTGFWGTDYGAPIHKALFGAIHQFLLYYYMNHPLKYMEKIVDNTLIVQRYDGHFSPIEGGGACEDLDAIDTLVNTYRRIDYRRHDIRRALYKALVATINTQAQDGGFLWAKRQRFGISNELRNLAQITRHRNFNYWHNSVIEIAYEQIVARRRPRLSLGWTKTGIPTIESDIFSTWFRSLNLALISKVLPENPYAEIPWKFLGIPGLGYFNETIS